MPNNLTGAYEAVVQVSVRQINGLLATLHQNGAKGSGLSPSFPHSLANLRVGDQPKYLQFETFEFSKWLGGTVQTFQSSGAPVTAVELAAKAPPGAAARFRAALEDVASAWSEVADPESVRGRAEIQVSTPTISLSPGSTSEVIVSVEIRARFVPDPGFAGLPQPIHGVVQVAYQVRPTWLLDKPILSIEVPAQDNKIVFTDLAGLNPADLATITARIRDAIRKEFKPESVALPADFRFFEFKELGGGQTIAIPLYLSDGAAPTGLLHTVTNAFLDPHTSDMAVAVSKEFILSKFQNTLTKLRQFQKSFDISLPWPLPDATYHFSVTSVDLQFQPGFIDLNIQGKATTRYVLAPNYNNIVVNQRLTLLLNVATQSVSLQALDKDLTITGLPAAAVGEATNAIIAERNKALNPPSPADPPQKLLNDKLVGGRTMLNDTLGKFFSSANYTALEITPDGVIVRGAIDTIHHYQPQMDIGYTEDGKSFTALNCWIPGGRIANYTWYWVETPVFNTPGFQWVIPWWGKQKSSKQPDRFTFPIPDAVLGQPSWSKGVCLSIEGDQIDRDGRITPVTGFEKSGTCEVSSFEPILVVDPLWEAIYGILWRPDPAPDVILEDVIAAHINMLAHPRPAGGLTTNALVHFTGSRSQSPLQALGQAVAAMRRPNVPLTVVVVMPEGTFRNRRADVEETLGMREERIESLQLNTADATAGAGTERPNAQLLITEDYGGGWTRTFDAQTTPASYLMNARGEFVWKQQDTLNIEGLTAALDEHLLFAPEPRARPLRLTIRSGDRAPDALFEEGEGLAVHRLRGKHVLLNFWQSWSAPCIRELRRLQRLYEEEGKRGLVIVAVNGGEKRTVVADARREHHLTFTVVHDPGQRIARLYGVQCWPTTVSINPDGIVDRIQFGAAHSRRAEEREPQAT